MRNELFSVLGGFLSANLLGGNASERGEIVKRSTEVDAKNFEYQIYVPPQAKVSENLPVIVFLHGIRERGTGGIIPTEGGLAAFIKQYFKQIPAIILLPQCRPGSYWSDPVMEQMVLQELGETIKEFNADSKRLYLLGVSMGGYGVWHFASHHAEKFAALVSICGGSSVLNGDRFSTIARKVGKTPVWLFHGAEDKVVPVSESRELAKALKENQGDVKYNEYKGVGHNVWMNVLAEKDLMPWLLSQKLK
ncbi:MAG TPA: alpha/beta hydrolase [Pyrinomonadaceae bacterium]|jgi:predicted peptidase